MLIGLNEALTSIILNLAEGNGRYSEQDHWITPRAAPTLCIHGTKDDYVGYEKATWMVDRLKAAERCNRQKIRGHQPQLIRQHITRHLLQP